MDLSPTENAPPPEWSDQKTPQAPAPEASTDNSFAEHLRGTDDEDEQDFNESIGLDSPASESADARESGDQQLVEDSESFAEIQEDRFLTEGIVVAPTSNEVPPPDDGLTDDSTDDSTKIPTEIAAGIPSETPKVVSTENLTELQSEPLVDVVKERQPSMHAIELEPEATGTVDSAAVDSAAVDSKTVEVVESAVGTGAKDGLDFGKDSFEGNVSDAEGSAESQQQVGSDAELESAGDPKILPPTVASIEPDAPITNSSGPSTESTKGAPFAKDSVQVANQVANQDAVAPPSSTQEESLDAKNSSSVEGRLPSDPLRTTGPMSYQASASSAIIEGVDGIVTVPMAATAKDETTSGTQITAGDHAASQATNPIATSADQLSNHLFSRAATQADGHAELNQSDQARFIKRVAQALQAAPQRGGVLRIRLHPPELGSMSLEVVTRRGAVTARIETESHVARTLLLDNLPELKERLEQQGVRIERFDVDVSEREPGNEFQQSRDAQEQSTSSRSGKSVQDDESAESANTEVPQVFRRVNSIDGNINVVI